MHAVDPDRDVPESAGKPADEAARRIIDAHQELDTDQAAADADQAASDADQSLSCLLYTSDAADE